MSLSIRKSALGGIRHAALAVLAIFLVSSLQVLAQEAKPAAGTVKAEVGKPLQAAMDLLKAKKYKDAMAKIHDAEAAMMIGGKTPYEVYLVQRVKGQIAANSGEPIVAAEAFESAIASGAIPASDKVLLLNFLSVQYYAAKQYAKCGDAATRYFKEGGTDSAVRNIQIQAIYLSGDLAQASRELQAEIAATEQSGKPASEIHLQMLADITSRSKDNRLFTVTLEKLVADYPKKEYWQSLVYSVASKASPRLLLDVLRIKLATDTMRSADEYVEAAQLAIQAGFPTEAKKFLDAGYAAGMLGTGADAARHKRLQDTTMKSIAEDTKSLGQDDAKASTAATGEALINTGLNYVFRGQADKGLPMMEQALKIGGFKRPDDAKLHYGLALVISGRKPKAVEVLNGVRGLEGAAELARLWVLVAQRGS